MNKERNLTKQFDRYVSVPHLHTVCPACKSPPTIFITRAGAYHSSGSPTPSSCMVHRLNPGSHMPPMHL